MKKLFILLISVSLFACGKVANNYLDAVSNKPFFKDSSEAFAKVRKGIKRFHSAEELKTINRISYMYSAGKSYAIVFYTSNKRSHHLIIQRDYSGSIELNESYITCDGDACDCEAVAIIGKDGTLQVGCTCPTCDKLIVTTIE